MASTVDICNQALLEVGGGLITALTDQSVEAQACNILYPTSLDYVLEAREWSFAIKRRILAASTTSPEFGHTHRFKIPSDCLRVLECFASGDNDLTCPNTLQWEREGEYIGASSAVVQIRYLARITDTTKFSAGFTKSLVMHLASELAIPIQRSRSLQEVKYSLFERKLAEAAATDGMQGRTRKIRSSVLLTSRRR